MVIIYICTISLCKYHFRHLIFFAPQVGPYFVLLLKHISFNVVQVPVLLWMLVLLVAAANMLAVKEGTSINPGTQPCRPTRLTLPCLPCCPSYLVCARATDIESLQNRMLKVCYVPTTSNSLNRVLFFIFSLQPLTVPGNTKGGSITVQLTSSLTGLESAVWLLTNFCFYLQNRLIQTSQTGGQPYSDTSPFSIPWQY